MEEMVAMASGRSNGLHDLNIHSVGHKRIFFNKNE